MQPKYFSKWISAKDLNYPNLDLPITQVYGICFNDKGDVLLMKKTNGSYGLPGGTPDEGESHIETLEREILEEVTVTIENPVFIGARYVEFTEGVDERSGHKKFYQLRFIAKIKEILDQKPDPDNGEMVERVFVPVEKANEYLGWGEHGDEVFAEAINILKFL